MVLRVMFCSFQLFAILQHSFFTTSTLWPLISGALYYDRSFTTETRRPDTVTSERKAVVFIICFIHQTKKILTISE